MARTDVHAPTRLVTEDYTYWGAYDGREGLFARDENTGEVYETVKGRTLRMVNETGGRWARTHEHNGDQCDHCGAYLRWVAVMRHEPTGDFLRVGETCLANRFERATADFQAMRKQAELDREKMRIKAAREEYFADNPNIRPVYERFTSKDHVFPEFSDAFLSDLMRKLMNYGSLSEKQTPWVAKCIDRFVERKLREQEREAEKATVADVEEGTYEFTGSVVSLKEHFSDFGTSWKMTIKADDGRVYWGTVPSGLWSHDLMEFKDHQITLTIKAAVTRSDKDRTFGFFKRPRLLEVTDDEGTTSYRKEK